MNLIKGFDRMAILLAIPMAIWGGHSSYLEFVESNKVPVCLSPKEEKALKESYVDLEDEDLDEDLGMHDYFARIAHMRLFDYPKDNGFIAEGERELLQQSKKSFFAKSALDFAFGLGADPCGALIEDWTASFSERPSGFFYIWPRYTKRILAGLWGAIYYATALVIGAGLATRCTAKCYRWVKNGFLSEGSSSKECL